MTEEEMMAWIYQIYEDKVDMEKWNELSEKDKQIIIEAYEIFLRNAKGCYKPM